MPERLAGLNDTERQHSVILVQDALTRYIDTRVAAALLELAVELGFQVFVAHFLSNGKPLHVQGFAVRHAAMRCNWPRSRGGGAICWHRPCHDARVPAGVSQGAEH